MALDAYISNPIGWAQLMLLGGPRRVLGMAGIYAGIHVAANVLIYRALRDDVSLRSFADASLAITTMVQAGLFVLAGCSAIKKAVHRDFTSDMITSHRNSAMTGQVAVLGYLTGATISVLSLSAVNLLAMTLLAALAGHSPAAPLFIFAMLGCLTVFLWVLAILAGLSSRGTFSIVGVVIILGFVANAQSLIMIHPGLSLLLSYGPILALMRAGAGSSPELSVLVSMITQLTLAAILFLAAARKFQRDDIAAFSPVLSYILLAVITLVSAVGLRYFNASMLPVMFAAPPDTNTQFIVTLASLAVLALLPQAVAARMSAQWAKRKSVDSAYDRPQPRHWLEAAIISTLIVFFIMIVVSGSAMFEVFELTQHPVSRQLGASALAFVLTLVSIGGLMRLGYGLAPKVGAIVVLVLALLWAGPPLVELAMESLITDPFGREKSWVFGASPVGTWIVACTRMNAPLWPGLIVQGLIAIAFMLLARLGASKPGD